MEVFLSSRATTVQSRLQLNWRNDATSILSQSEEIVPRTTLSSSCQDSRFTVVDEVSILGSSLFEKLDYIVRGLRASSKLFGGIQLMLCGDFSL